MSKKTYCVLGATGQVGRVVAEQLYRKGHHVKAIGRHPQKLDFLKSQGLEIVRVEGFDKKHFLNEAFKGADGVFCMLPPGQGVDDFPAYQDSVGEAIKEAIEKNNIKFVVNLSSLGAHLPEGTGPIKGLYRQEQRLNELSNVNVLHLRPGYFMENFFWAIPGIIHTNLLQTPLRADLELAPVSVFDIGTKASVFLDKLDFQGSQVFDLVGPREMLLDEAAVILGNAIGKPDLQYRQIPYEEAKQGMLSVGVKSSLADLLIEMYTAFNEKKCQPDQNLSGEHLGKTSLEQFAKFFAEAYKQAENHFKAHI